MDGNCVTYNLRLLYIRRSPAFRPTSSASPQGKNSIKVDKFFWIVPFFLTFFDSPKVKSDSYDLPPAVKVVPVGFIPKGERPITNADQKLFLKHLNWTRDDFAKLLGGDTFELAESKMVGVQGRENLKFYRRRPQNGAPEIVVELLDHFKVTRFNNPYVFCVLVANRKKMIIRLAEVERLTAA